MRITEIKYELVHIHEKELFKLALAEIDTAESVYVKIITDSGICGYGEGTPFAPVTGETGSTVIHAIQMFIPALIGMDPGDLATIHAKMNSILRYNTAAKCAIDLALYDIMGKAKELPLYKLLGGTDNRLVTDVTLGMGTPEHMADKAADWVSQGYRILKVKAGLDKDHDAAALTMIRERVGPNVKIRVDLNQSSGVQGTLDRLPLFKRLKIEAVEQPCPYWDLDGMSELKQKMEGITLIADESLSDEHDIVRIAKHRAADIVNIKLMKCGGLFPAQRANAIAAAEGIQCMVGCMFEDRIAITAAMSLVASSSNIIEADCDSFLLSDAVSIPVTGGFENIGEKIQLLDQPGLGITVDF